MTGCLFYEGEDLPPYLLFGDSGQTIEETNKLLSVALTEVSFEVLRQSEETNKLLLVALTEVGFEVLG